MLLYGFYRCVYYNITFYPRLQEALAQAIEHELKLLGTKDSYWTWLVDTLHSKRDHLAKMVRASGMIPIIPEGGYFMLADTSPLSLYLKNHFTFVLLFGFPFLCCAILLGIVTQDCFFN